MGYPPTSDHSFRETIARWLESTGEVLTLIRYHAAAGSRDFEFFRSFPAFLTRLAELPPRTCVIVFGECQLPLRGRVDDAFIAKALELVPDGVEWLAVGLSKTIAASRSWYHQADGMSHAELKEELDSQVGAEFAVGLYPPWLEDAEFVISAVVPPFDDRLVY